MRPPLCGKDSLLPCRPPPRCTEKLRRLLGYFIYGFAARLWIKSDFSAPPRRLDRRLSQPLPAKPDKARTRRRFRELYVAMRGVPLDEPDPSVPVDRDVPADDGKMRERFVESDAKRRRCLESRDAFLREADTAIGMGRQPPPCFGIAVRVELAVAIDDGDSHRIARLNPCGVFAAETQISSAPVDRSGAVLDGRYPERRDGAGNDGVEEFVLLDRALNDAIAERRDDIFRDVAGRDLDDSPALARSVLFKEKLRRAPPGKVRDIADLYRPQIPIVGHADQAVGNVGQRVRLHDDIRQALVMRQLVQPVIHSRPHHTA